MTAARKTLWKWIGAVLGIGISWGALTADVHSKLPASRFEVDSTRRDAIEAADHAILLRVDSRVSAIYCASIPDSLRAGCQ